MKLSMFVCFHAKTRNSYNIPSYTLPWSIVLTKIYKKINEIWWILDYYIFFDTYVLAITQFAI